MILPLGVILVIVTKSFQFNHVNVFIESFPIFVFSVMLKFLIN